MKRIIITALLTFSIAMAVLMWADNVYLRSTICQGSMSDSFGFVAVAPPPNNDELVRLVRVQRLNDPALLAELAENAANENVRRAATQRLDALKKAD
jgi:hypothetical protein